MVRVGGSSDASSSVLNLTRTTAPIVQRPARLENYAHKCYTGRGHYLGHMSPRGHGSHACLSITPPQDDKSQWPGARGGRRLVCDASMLSLQQQVGVFLAHPVPSLRQQEVLAMYHGEYSNARGARRSRSPIHAGILAKGSGRGRGYGDCGAWMQAQEDDNERFTICLEWHR